MTRTLMLAVLLGLSTLAQAHYESHPQAQGFLQTMLDEGFTREEVERVLALAEKQESVLKAISRPAERRLTWGEYRRIFIDQKRIDQGLAFWDEHQEALVRAEQQYGVAPEVIVAIIGVETRYGRNKGSYRVVDALATLAFDYPPRSTFFTKQLRELLVLAREEQLPPESLYGSYAGAMGFGQFIPSSYRSFAVDFDGDGQRDIWNNPTDAIGSVANYFARHGWTQNGVVTVPATVEGEVDSALFNAGLKPSRTLAEWAAAGVKPAVPLDLAPDLAATAMALEIDGETQYWLGLPNFYTITRYNHSSLYAMAVYQLADGLRQTRLAREG